MGSGSSMGGGSSAQLGKFEGSKASSREAVANAVGKAEDVERATKELERFVVAKIEYHQQKAVELERRFEEFMKRSEEKVRNMELNTKTLEDRMVRNLEKVDRQLQEMESKSKKFEDFVNASREDIRATERSVKLLEERSEMTHRELQSRMKITLFTMEESLERANLELAQMEKDNQEKYERITQYLESVSAMGQMFAYAGRALSWLSKAVFLFFYFPWWLALQGIRWYENRQTKLNVTNLTGVMAAGNGSYRFQSHHHGTPCFKREGGQVFLYFVQGSGWHISPRLGSTDSWAYSRKRRASLPDQLEVGDEWTCSGEVLREVVSVQRPCCTNAAARPAFWWLGAVNALILAWAMETFLNPMVDIELLPLEVPFIVWALSIALLVTVGTIRDWRDGSCKDSVYKQVLALLGENTQVEMHFDDNVMFIFGMLPALMSSFLTYYFTRDLNKSMDCNPDYTSATEDVAYCVPVSVALGALGQQEVCCRVLEEARFTLTTFIAFLMSNAQAGYLGVKYAVRMAMAAQMREGKAEDLLTKLRTSGSRRVHDSYFAGDTAKMTRIVPFY